MKNTFKAYTNKRKETDYQKRFNFTSLLIFISYFFIPIILMIIFLNIFKRNFDRLVNFSLQFDYFKNIVKDISSKEEINEIIFKKIIFLLANIFTVISFFITLLLTKKRNDSISYEKSSFSIKKKILIGFFLGIFMIFWTVIISVIYSKIGFDATSNNTNNIINYLKGEKFMLFLILIVAPIGEEIAFKYGLFTFFHEIFKFNKKFLKIILPAFISAFVFGIIHDGLLLIPIYFIPSFIGCLIYERTKSLMPCIIGHFINNFIVIIILSLK